MSVTVYTLPTHCQACKMTIKQLEGRVDFTVKTLDDAETVARFKAQGHMQAPVVVTDTDTWSGFRPDKLVGLTSPRNM